MMMVKKRRSELPLYQPASPGRVTTRRIRWSLCGLLAAILAYWYLPPALLYAGSPAVTHEIRYHLPEAGEVTLVWGINGWVAVPEEMRLTGTILDERGTMNTPMAREGDSFVARLQVPAGATIDYGFQVAKMRAGAKEEGWDFRPPGAIIARPGAVTNVRLTRQEIRYYAPEANQVLLVWNTPDWIANSLKSIQPEGTVVQDGWLVTPMEREGDTFVAQVRVPSGVTLDYSFLITQSRSGAAADIRDTNGEEGYSTVTSPAGVVAVEGVQGEAGKAAVIFEVMFYLLLGLVIILGAGLLLHLAPLHRPGSIALVLAGLTVLGLLLRLAMVWNTNQELPLTAERLSGTELAYDELAFRVQEGTYFSQSSYMPLYPFFLAGCYLFLGHSYGLVLYVQAFIGALAIPLTFLLALRFTRPKLSLLAATVVALHPALALQATRLSEEALYTPLLLVALLGLLWALERPRLHRFFLAGIPLAGATLCQPTTALFPIGLLLLLPRARKLKRKIILSLAYAAATIAVLLPWVTYNYQTHHTYNPLVVSGMALWQGSPEFFYLVNAQTSNAELWNRYLNPQYNGGHDPTTMEGDHYFLVRALSSISAHPGNYALYSLPKLLLFWLGHPTTDWPDDTFFNIETMRLYSSTSEIAGILAARLLPLLALIVLIFGYKLRNGSTLPGPLLVLCGYFMLVHALTYPGVRYSEALYPVLVAIIVIAAKQRERSFYSSATASVPRTLLYQVKTR